MNSPQEIIEGLAERLNQMIKSGTPHNNAIGTLVNQLESNASIDRKQAVALVDLAIEAFANKYEQKRVFSDDQLKQRIEFLMPSAAKAFAQNQQQQGFNQNNSEFDKL